MKINAIKNYNVLSSVQMNDSLPNKKTRQENISMNLSNSPIAYYNKMGISFMGLESKKNISKHDEEHYIGCILGGAIGDALGADIEFIDIEHIKKYYGRGGIQELETDMSGVAEFSDDTQMTIFTIDGLLKSIADKFDPNKAPQIEDMHKSYLNWYKTQNEIYVDPTINDGWIIRVGSLYERKAPGETCLRSLESGKIGTTSEPINQSKGSGGVMRVAPIGLLYYQNPELAFKIGVDNAAITHGHPSGYLSAGFLSSLIANIISGFSLKDSIENAFFILKKQENSEEVIDKVLLAKNLAEEDVDVQEAIRKIGQGWTAEEALGISLYCALKSPKNYKDAIRMAVNHSGDSDTTGAITGNIMGALLGKESIPKDWISKIQGKKLLTTLAQDLINVPENPTEHKERYPYNCGLVPNYYVKSLKIQPEPRKLEYSFSEEEISKMRNMTADEIIAYKKELLKRRTI